MRSTAEARRRVRTIAAAALCATLVAAAGCSRGWAEEAVHVPTLGPESTNPREFGITGDPWQVGDWADAVGAEPTMVMEFEQWHQDRTLDTHFEEAERRGLTSFMVTWEPWVPVPAHLGKEAQYADQPDYNNEAIASGALDGYIQAFARSVADSDLTIYIRHAHEMNGDWYPWSRDPENYVLAWRHIVDIFRTEGATNARFVFSLNPSLYLEPDRWQETAEEYWPGDDYVDLLGTTMINFGGRKDYSVADFAERVELMCDLFGKDLIVSELNTAFDGRVRWLTDLRTWLATEAHWVVGVVFSQTESRGQIQMGTQVGDLSWSVTSDPATRPVVKGMVEDLTQPRRGS